MPGAPLDTAAETLAGIGALSPPEALTRLQAIAEALRACGSPERLGAIAGALPRHIADLSPEVALALAGVALALAHHNPRLPEDLERLGPRLRVEWLRVRLATQAGMEPVDATLLLRALSGWSLADAADPHSIIEFMAHAGPRLRAAVLERLGPAVHHLAITPDQACTWLLTLANDPEPSVRRAAFAGLSQTALTRLSPALRAARAKLVRAALDDPDHEIGRTCVALAASLGAREWLVELAFDEQADGAQRVAALEGLGPLAQAEDLPPALELAVADPLCFGSVTRRFVLEAHRHGTFIRAPQLPTLLAAFDSHQGWTGEALVRVTHIARTELIAALAQLPADDPRWIRRATILAASIDASAPSLIAALLRTTTDPEIARALINAAGRSPDFAEIEPLLSWLACIPEPVIAVLRVKARDETREAVIERLRAIALDRRTVKHVREPAIDAAWALSRERRALLHELCEQLGPHAAGLLDPKRRSIREPVAAELLSEPPWRATPNHAIDPLAALSLLCDSGQVEQLAEVTRRFRELFGDYVREALAGDFTIKRVRIPALEQLLYRYGRQLIADGRSVRRWVEDGPDTGRELVLAVVIEWLREDPPAPVCVALLETLARHEPTGASLRRIEEFWRHRDPELRRAAIEAILAAGEGARGLELSICKLSDSGDARLLRQALLGVASLAARWAEPMAIAALSRPEMGVKKEAAAALAIVGTGRCVGTIVDWLGLHDNAAFRAALLAALDAVTKTGAAAVLVDALDGADTPRRRTLLREALSRRLSLAAILRLARTPRPSAAGLIQAALDGELLLADATPATLAAALHRAKLRTLPTRDDPTQALRRSGFSAEAALALLEHRSPQHEASILAVVRAGLAEWIGWLRSDAAPEGPANVAALGLSLEAVSADRSEHTELLLELAQRSLSELEPALVANFLERCLLGTKVPLGQRARALAMLRGLAISPGVGGLRRFSLLGKLGAVRDRSDLDRCLAECRIGPKLAHDSAQLLSEALSIPSKRPDEALRLGVTAAAVLDDLRERATSWYRSPPAEADAWLSEQLAARPIDLPTLGFGSKPERERSKRGLTPGSRAQLDELLAILDGDQQHDRQARETAAERILAQADAALITNSWARVLELYLAGDIELSAAATAALACSLERWPGGHARGLFEHLDHPQRQRFLPSWIAAWEQGDAEAEALLKRVDQQLLIPEARTRAAVGDYSLVRLLDRDGSVALDELVEFVGARTPDEVAHLVAPEPAPEPEMAKAFVDPIADLDLDALVATIREPSVEIGLAVRAIHALTKFEERGADALEPFTLDRRGRVRSAALRALRKAAPRERSLHATVEVIGIETRGDVLASLLASIAHAHFQPGLPRLLAHVIHRDPKLREAAEKAVLAWGSELLPELRRATRKARPDRRPAYEALVAALSEQAQR